MEANSTLNGLAGFEDLFVGEAQAIWNDLRHQEEQTRKDLEAARKEGQILKIGIVGQIKRGKSSFINALLFDGDDILPKAATPMTAALTRIRYSQTPSAEVEFFTEEEWKSVEQTASLWDTQQNNGNCPDIIACHELVEAVKKGGLNPRNFIDKGKIEIDTIRSNDELVGKLQDYVGAGGRYTPFVKCTQLNLAIDALKGIEFVDTPGMNDPIISRSQRTRDFLGECHVVFLLSKSDQFLDEKDLQLLAQSLPNRAVSRYFLVGSMLDSLLQDCHQSYTDIKTALREEIGKATRKAQQDVERYRNESNTDNYVIEAIGKALPPHFISSMAYQIAKHWNALNEDETFYLEKFNSLFEGFVFNEYLLYKLAGFEGIQRKIEEVRMDTVELIGKKEQEIRKRSAVELKRLANSLKEQLEHRLAKLQEGDLEQLAQTHKALMETLKKGKIRINGIFESHEIEIEKKFREIQSELGAVASQASRLDVKTGTKTDSYTTGWWIFKKTHHYTITYQYANTVEAIQQLENFVLNAEQSLIESMKHIIDLDNFKRTLITELKTLLDTSSDSFNPQDILIPVGNAVNRITIPDFELDVYKHVDTIRNKFHSSQVRGSQVGELQAEQSRIAYIILSDIKTEVTNKSGSMISRLEKIREDFLPGISANMNEELEQLEKDLKDKETTQKRYLSTIEILLQISSNSL